MISRVWRGWTTPENAASYEQLLLSEIFPGIAARRIPGYHGIDLLRRDTGDMVEFMTVMWFDSIEAVRRFAGPEHETAVVPARAQALLLRFDRQSAHYEVRRQHSRDG